MRDLCNLIIDNNLVQSLSISISYPRYTERPRVIYLQTFSKACFSFSMSANRISDCSCRKTLFSSSSPSSEMFCRRGCKTGLIWHLTCGRRVNVPRVDGRSHSPRVVGRMLHAFEVELVQPLTSPWGVIDPFNPWNRILTSAQSQLAFKPNLVFIPGLKIFTGFGGTTAIKICLRFLRGVWWETRES